MSGPKTTVQSDTFEHIVLGPGVTTLNLGEVGERQLGGASDGGSFDLTRTKRIVAIAGAKGRMKGGDQIEEVLATLTVRLKDITKEDVVAAIAGANVADDTPAGWDTITGGDIESTDYITNVAYAAAYSSLGNDVICLIKNALAGDSFSLAAEDKGEGVIEIVFESRFDPAASTVEPWEIRFPKV